MADLPAILARLRGDAAVGRLASLLVEDAMARSLGELVDPGLLAEAVRQSLRALAGSASATQHVVERVEAATTALGAEGRPLRARVPAQVAEGAAAIARLPMAPSHDALIKLLDREPIKRLLKAQVVEALSDFGRRAASPVAESTIARGLGGISKLALGPIGSRRNPLARVANAVSGEVERQVEKRAAEFADTAVAGILAGIVEHVTDPARQDEQAALRVAVVDGLFEMTGTDLAGLLRGDPRAQVDAVCAALGAWSADAAFVADVKAAIGAAIAPDLKRPLGDVLADFALREPVAAHARAVVERTLAHLFAGDAFAGWLAEIVAE